MGGGGIPETPLGPPLLDHFNQRKIFFKLLNAFHALCSLLTFFQN